MVSSILPQFSRRREPIEMPAGWALDWLVAQSLSHARLFSLLHSSQLTFDMIMYICCAAICIPRVREGGVCVCVDHQAKTLIYQRFVLHSFCARLFCTLLLPGLSFTLPYSCFSLPHTHTHTVVECVPASVGARQKCPYNIFYFVTQILK